MGLNVETQVELKFEKESESGECKHTFKSLTSLQLSLKTTIMYNLYYDLTYNQIVCLKHGVLLTNPIYYTAQRFSSTCKRIILYRYSLL